MNYFDFEEISVLDLFCGTGNISFEFGSRGSSNIVAVDENVHCVKFASETFRKLDLQKAKTVRADVFRFLEKNDSTYDIIFADPPYELVTTDKIPDIVMEKKLLNEGGWLIVEHQAKRKLQSIVQPDEIRKYGNCAFSIFKGMKWFIISLFVETV